MHPAALCREFEGRCAARRAVLLGRRRFRPLGPRLAPGAEPGGWLRLGPLGAIGSALPNGLALQLAHPGRPVAVITGDGALGFYIAEMDTAVRHKLPIVVVVGNDAGWGLERELQSAATAGRPWPASCNRRVTTPS